LLVVVAVPTIALTAFGGSGSSTTSSGGRWAGGKVKAAPGSAGELVSAARQKAAVDRLIRFGVPIYCSGGRGNYVALTFDDGPSLLTPQFLKLLRDAGARATFFVVGANMTSSTFAGYARDDTKLGAMGDHTWTHAALGSLPEDQVVSEIGRAKRAIVKTTGAPVLVFRPPFASHSSTVGRVSNQFGMLEILWNTDSKDWAGRSWDRIADNVLAGLAPGAIVLMHDTRSETIKALRSSILPALKLRGLKAVTLPELFALDPPSEAQVREDANRGACSHGQFDGT
jgi:peptidoglycan/xylan/chitin deacetylase (PgdA/CDA1 family)